MPSERSWQSRAGATGRAAALLPDGGDAALATILSSPRPADGSRPGQEAWEEVEDSLAAALAAAAQQQRQQLAISPPGPPHRIPPSSLATFPQPAPCAFLRPGQSFEGGQRVAHHHGAIPKQETWEVKAVIQVRACRVLPPPTAPCRLVIGAASQPHAAWCSPRTLGQQRLGWPAAIPAVPAPKRPMLQQQRAVSLNPKP